MEGLDRNTKYYLRAYATNANGTAYGNEVSFTTLSTIEVKVGGTTYIMHEDATFSSVWGPTQTTGANSGSSGQTNTATLAKLSAENAGKKCAQLTTLGFSDWYLPSTGELKDIFDVDPEIFPTGQVALWSSTENDDQSAYLFNFKDPFGGPDGGVSMASFKLSDQKCVCIRIK
ncbi:DUF1566 domain-containing protein [bacterium]|nr:DUF1566 domain-containing protein [bacterium]